MAKVYMICGKLCSGKTTYARKLCHEKSAVLLSTDEITLALFGQHCGDKHDEYVEKTQTYLFQKSLEILNNRISVVLDWGFWQQNERDFARAFYQSHGIDFEFHAIEISDSVWFQRLTKRNAMVEKDPTIAYYVDENLARKFASLYEPPYKNEIDVWIQSE